MAAAENGRVDGVKHFYCVARGIMVAPQMDAVMRHSELWNALSEPQQIILRNGADWRDTDAGKALAGIKRIALDAMNTLGASQLGQLVIQKIAPAARAIYKPVKADDPFAQYRLVLHAMPGSLFLCGDETVIMEAGELWYVDAKSAHAVNNVTKDDLVHVLMQLRHDA